jgi:hypothetical protein
MKQRENRNETAFVPPQKKGFYAYVAYVNLHSTQ